MTFLGVTPERIYDDIGAWTLASDLRTLALKGARQSPTLFSIANANTLRRLDTEGQVIESELNYDVQREPTYRPLAPQVPLRGMYAADESGAVFEECTTGLKLRVKGAGAAPLNEEYSRMRRSDTRPMLLAVEGKIVGADVNEDMQTLAVTAAAKFWPGESCGARGVTHDLEGSRWVLVRLGEQSVVAQEGRPEPYVVLQAATKQIVGHASCNRLSGGYTITGNTLQFTEIRTTRMACPEIETENAFLTALESVAQWQLMDNQLVLLDSQRQPLIQLESRNL